MNDEIKEILDRIETASEIFDCLLRPKECTLLLDYITNLQQKYNGIKSNFDIQLEYDKELENKITNLQEELKSANESISWCQNRFNAVEKENNRLKELCDKYEEEHNTAFKLWKMKMEEIPTYEEKEDYKSRIDKAIEYVNLYAGSDNNYCLDYHDLNPLLEILKGDSNE